MKYRMYSPQAIFEVGRSGNQEDSIYPAYGTASADDRLFIVCDGDGSRTNGNIASKTISNSVASYLRRNTSYDKNFSDAMLADAIDYACQELKKKGDTTEGLGTTFAFLYFHRGGVTAAYLGDTRIFHIRPSLVTEANGSPKKGLQFASRDVSSGAATGADGAAAPATASRLILANATTKPRVIIQHISDVRQGDYFVACSKGMLEGITDEDLVQLLSEKGSDEKKRKQLVATTIDNNENHSAYIIHLENVMAEAGDDDYSSSSVGDTISYGHYGSSKKKRNYGAVLKYLLAAVLALAVIYLGYDYFSNRPASPEPKAETAAPDSTVNVSQQSAPATEAQSVDTVAKPTTAMPAVKPAKTTTRSQEEQSASSWLYDNNGNASSSQKTAEQTETKTQAPTPQPAAVPEPAQPAAPAPQPSTGAESGGE